MFENQIRSTKLTGSLADNMFRHISGSGFSEDVSLLSTLRALLMNRCPDNETIEVVNSSDTLTNGYEIGADKCADHSFIVINCVSNISESKENTKQFFNEIRVPEGYVELTDVQPFFAQKMSCRAFINESAHSTIVCILDMDLKRYHLMQCITPRLLPWFFAGNSLTINERALLHTLHDRIYTAYEQAINRLIDTYEFRNRVMSATLTNMRMRSLERQRNNAAEQIAAINERIDEFSTRIGTLMRDKNNLLHRLIGIEAAATNDDNGAATRELNEFLRSVNCIECVPSDNVNEIHIIVKGHLDIYDPDDYKSIARNRNGWYWSTSTSNFPLTFRNMEARKKVMDHIFCTNPTFKIKTCGYFKLCLEECYSSAKSRHTYGERYNDCYPNPHLNYNSCLGSYRPLINQALGDGNLVAAFSRCITSVHTVNVAEAASFSYLCRDLFSDCNRPYLEGPDGKLYSTLEAYQYLCQKEQQGE